MRSRGGISIILTYGTHVDNPRVTLELVNRATMRECLIGVNMGRNSIIDAHVPHTPIDQYKDAKHCRRAS